MPQAKRETSPQNTRIWRRRLSAQHHVPVPSAPLGVPHDRDNNFRSEALFAADLGKWLARKNPEIGKGEPHGPDCAAKQNQARAVDECYLRGI